MDEFGLSPATGPPPGYAAPSVVCAEVGVTPTTLAKWRTSNRWDLERDGPAIAVQAAGKFGPTWYYDLERVRLWATKDRPQGVGGARPGSGRKKKGQRDKGTEGRGEAPSALGPSDPSCPSDRSPLQVAADQALADSLSDPTQIARLVKDGKITRSEAQTLYDLIKHSRGVVALKAERGELVEADDVRKNWTEAIGRIGRALDTFPALAAAEVLAACGLPAETAVMVRAAIDRKLAELRTRIVDEGQRVDGRVPRGSAAA